MFIFVKGWSMGEPKVGREGTYDVLELWINVSIRSTGNIVFEIFDTSEEVLPGECAEYVIGVPNTSHQGTLFSHYLVDQKNVTLQSQNTFGAR